MFRNLIFLLTSCNLLHLKNKLLFFFSIIFFFFFFNNPINSFSYPFTFFSIILYIMYVIFFFVILLQNIFKSFFLITSSSSTFAPLLVIMLLSISLFALLFHLIFLIFLTWVGNLFNHLILYGIHLLQFNLIVAGFSINS